MVMNCTVHPESAAISYCRTCGKPMCEICRRNVRGTYYCEECLANRLQDAIPPAAPVGTSVPMPPPVDAHAPSPGLAAILGFIPGVGAMYNGQFAKALVHVLIFISIIWIASNGSGFFGIFIPFFVFYMVFDAYKTARARTFAFAVRYALRVGIFFCRFASRCPATSCIARNNSQCCGRRC